VASAPHWAGPYTRVSQPTRPQMPKEAQEDPFVFIDSRGGFHMLTHIMQRVLYIYLLYMHRIYLGLRISRCYNSRVSCRLNRKSKTFLLSLAAVFFFLTASLCASVAKSHT
jgi:hypothetical protein